MQTLSNKRIAELLESYTFSVEVELEHLSYFKAIFQAIKADKTNGGHSVTILASLGEYLANDFIYYSQLNIDKLEAEFREVP